MQSFNSSIGCPESKCKSKFTSKLSNRSNALSSLRRHLVLKHKKSIYEVDQIIQLYKNKNKPEDDYKDETIEKMNEIKHIQQNEKKDKLKWECECCGKKYKFENTLNNHMRVKHTAYFKSLENQKINYKR